MWNKNGHYNQNVMNRNSKEKRDECASCDQLSNAFLWHFVLILEKFEVENLQFFLTLQTKLMSSELLQLLQLLKLLKLLKMFNQKKHQYQGSHKKKEKPHCCLRSCSCLNRKITSAVTGDSSAFPGPGTGISSASPAEET